MWKNIQIICTITREIAFQGKQPHNLDRTYQTEQPAVTTQRRINFGPACEAKATIAVGTALRGPLHAEAIEWRFVGPSRQHHLVTGQAVSL